MAQPDLLKEHNTAAAEDLWEQLMPFILTLSNTEEEEEKGIIRRMEGRVVGSSLSIKEVIKKGQNRPEKILFLSYRCDIKIKHYMVEKKRESTSELT